jgi:hypothetical protein
MRKIFTGKPSIMPLRHILRQNREWLATALVSQMIYPLIQIKALYRRQCSQEVSKQQLVGSVLFSQIRQGAVAK